MKRYEVWCVCLLAWVVALSGSAFAGSEYEALCAEGNVTRGDVVAWLDIPQAPLCLPVMQNSDDAFYSGHDAAGAESERGALYTQSAYNAADFSDPATVIYGSSRMQGAPFRDLQELYSGRFEECRRIYLHLPEKTLEYEVFAAIPYSSVHILHYYDFAVERRFETFLDSVYSTRRLGMHLDEEERPESGDRILILSTGLRGDGTQRYLVMAKLIMK